MVPRDRSGWPSCTCRSHGLRTSSILMTSKWVDGFESCKSAEVAISVDEFGLHRLSAAHKIEQGVPVKHVNSRQFRSFPTVLPQLVGLLGRGKQGATKKVVGHRLEGAAFFGGLSLQFAENLVVDRQSDSCHMQKHASAASRCQMAADSGQRRIRVCRVD